MLAKIKNKIGHLGVRIIRFLSRKLHLSLLDIGLSEAGYTKSYSLKASGELSFVRDYLKKYVGLNPTFFDVGSNVGQYATLLRKFYPEANIHFFEPNPATFAKLQMHFRDEKFLNNLGLSDKVGELELFFQADNHTSVQASLNKEVVTDIAGAQNLSSASVRIVTIDSYSIANNVDRIDFLKIDTEGFELEVLHGAAGLLKQKKIRCIQFEFNEVNIVKRRFIKDFYDLLPDYDFYRLDENRMIPMNNWSPNHEIFRFQNVVAILRQ